MFALHVWLAVGSLGQGERLAEHGLVLDISHQTSTSIRHSTLVHQLQHVRERKKKKCAGLIENRNGASAPTRLSFITLMLHDFKANCMISTPYPKFGSLSFKPCEKVNKYIKSSPHEETVSDKLT